MISALFVLNEKGDVLISRLFRNDVKRSAADQFRIHVLSNPSVRSPVTTINNISFLHVRTNGVYVVAALRQNCNLAIVFEFLYRIVNLGTKYFGCFGETEVRNNFVMLYELIDEICDFGYPQTTEIESLMKFIKTSSVKSDKASSSAQDAQQIAIQTTGAVPWRRPDVKYRRNEAFVDVIESVNILISATGTVLRSDAAGSVTIRAYLTGMPECKIALNDALSSEVADRAVASPSSSRPDRVVLDDCHFHQCVNLSDYEKNRSIQFIPPDGECQLIAYRVASNVQQPFRVTPVVRIDSESASYSVHLRALFDTKLSAQNVVLVIPIPPTTRKIKHLSVSGFGSTTLGGGIGGKAKHSVGDNTIVWKIPKVQGGLDLTLTAEIDLSPEARGAPQWARPPISLDFRVLMYTASGLAIKYLKVFERSGYSTVKWVRYLTKAGSYQIKF